MAPLLALLLAATFCGGFAFLSRWGLISSYAAALVAWTITGSALIAVASSLTVTLASSILEQQGYSNEVETLASVNLQPATTQLTVGHQWRTLITRSGVLLASLVFVGSTVGKIPPLRLPAVIIVVVLAALIGWRHYRTRQGTNVTIAVIAGTVLLLKVLYLNQVATSTALIAIAAAANLLAPFLGNNSPSYPSKVYNSPLKSLPLRYLDLAWTTLWCWITPGLTPATSAKALSASSDNLPLVGAAAALIEGWVLGAWVYHGNLSGKTMLGAALQTWGGANLDQTNTAILVAVALSLALITNLLVSSCCWVPLQPTNHLTQLVISAPIILQLLFTTNPLILILCSLAAVMLAAISQSKPHYRSLVLVCIPLAG